MQKREVDKRYYLTSAVSLKTWYSRYPRACSFERNCRLQLWLNGGSAISQYELNHKILVEGFLAWNGTDYHWENNNIYAKFADDDGQLLIRFEDIGDKKRIESIDGLK
jgi:hypothetical protein